MNDDNLNYRFRLITFNDHVSVKDLDPEIGIPSVTEEPKAPKYSLSEEQVNSDGPSGLAARTTPTAQPRLSKSSSELMAKKTSKNKVLKKRRNTTSVEDFKRMFILQDHAYADKFLHCHQTTTKDRKVKEKVGKNRKKNKPRDHHKWHKVVKVIYTNETTKIPRRGRTYDQPPDGYTTHELPDNFKPLNKKDYPRQLHQNIFRNNPAVYFQSSGDCKRGIFGKFKKSRELEKKPCDHFPVAYIGDNCGESCSSCICARDASHFNVIRFPQESKPVPQPQVGGREKCRRSLTTVAFHDPETENNCRVFRSQPCQSIGQAYECEPMSNICKQTPNNNCDYESKTAPAGTYPPESTKKTSVKLCEAMPNKTCECKPTAKNPYSKGTSQSKSYTKKTSAKLCCRAEVKSKKKDVKDTKPNQTCAVNIKASSTKPMNTCPKQSQCRSDIPSVPVSTKTKKVFKYIFYSLTAIAWFPCVVLVSLCWLATYPLRPREIVPCSSNLTPQYTQNKPRGRNLCHLNRAPKVLLNTIDNWSTFRHVVAGACKSTRPSCQKTTSSRSCSTKPCSPCLEGTCTPSPVPCKKNRSRSNSNSIVTFDPCPITVPPCSSKLPCDSPRPCEWKGHPDPSQQYRMYYGGALRGWLMKPLSCYGTTCKKKAGLYQNVSPTTVMSVGDVFRKKTHPKKPSITKSKTSPSKDKLPRRSLFKGKNVTSKPASNTSIKSKKAVKFSQDIDKNSSPAPSRPLQQQPKILETPKSVNQVRKGETRPCTYPKTSKKPCKVCCQKVKPQLDPKTVGFVRYGKDKGKEKKPSWIPFKKKEVSVPNTEKKDKDKKKNKKKKKKIIEKEQFKGMVQSIRDAENEAWGTEEVKCDEVWVRTLRKKPCFWIYKRWPGMYPCFLSFHSCFANCASCCIMCLSTIFWCPLLICVFICFKGFCGK